MITGMHVRSDWDRLILSDRKYVRTLCGKTSSVNLTGIPSITDQPPAFVGIDKTAIAGWCTECMMKLAYSLDSMPDELNTTKDIAKRYTEIHKFVRSCLGNRPKSKTFITGLSSS